jgi:hypothetical protein
MIARPNTLPRELPVAPWCACPPPQDGEDSQERPPKCVGRLVCDDRKDDADDDANQRHEVAYANGHIVLLRRKPLDSKPNHPKPKLLSGEGRFRNTGISPEPGCSRHEPRLSNVSFG